MAVVTQPFIFVTGQIPTAAQWNANPAAWVAGFANIDNTNIGAAGIYASQIKPSGAAAATFGGTQAYTFPAGAQNTILSTAGFFPAVYTSAGAATANTQRIITGTANIASLPAGLTTLAVTFSGAAVFSGAGTFTVMLSAGTYSGTANGAISLSLSTQSTTGFTLQAYYTGSVTLTFVNINWQATGT
jgi:hypothetical protein